MKNGKKSNLVVVGLSILLAVFLFPDKAYCGWLPGQNMNYARRSHSATKLLDGTVLIARGLNPDESVILDTAEIYNPKDGTFTLVGNMTEPRGCHHTATLLLNGKVLVCGGWGTTGYLNTAEIYDPVSKTFQAIAQRMHSPRRDHRAVRLEDGKVFISGGCCADTETTGSCDLFNPVDNSFTEVGQLTYPRGGHSSLLLPNGNVLIAGGGSHETFRETNEIYQPGLGLRVSGIMIFPRANMPGGLLPDGRVLLIGGGIPYTGPTNVVEVYDPETELFTRTENLLELRDHHRSVVLPDGRILITGGERAPSVTQIVASTEMYDPITGHFSLSDSMTIPRCTHCMTLLDNGCVLITGGLTLINRNLFALASTEINCSFAPPIADAGPDQTVYADCDFTAEVTLDGSGSNDPDGDELTYNSGRLTGRPIRQKV